MPTTRNRSVLTTSQQGHVRSRMMKTAAQIAHQIDEYINTGKIIVADKEVVLTSERLASYRLILDRTVPTLSATEITHKTGLESMTNGQLLARLSALMEAKPELKAKLLEVMGGKTIEGAAQLVDNDKPDSTNVVPIEGDKTHPDSGAVMSRDSGTDDEDEDVSD